MSANDDQIDTHALINLHSFHLMHCNDYARIISMIYPDWGDPERVDAIPPLPVRFFKEYDLKSDLNDSELKLMVSSGTTGARSKIFLSRENGIVQQKALLNLGRKVLGPERLPMLIMDTSAVQDPSHEFSARAAGINGFKLFSKHSKFVLDQSGELDQSVIDHFAAVDKFFAFGFTWVMWNILRDLDNRNQRFPPGPDITLIHGGGWKKLEGTGVSKKGFQELAMKVFGPKTRVIDYYGMIEQTGSIYFECTAGYFHDTEYGSVIIRDPETMVCLSDGELGLIQVNSVLPRSYPGHSLLTEDLGKRWLGKCECGLLSPRFQIVGRLKKVDVRGCSDAT